MSDEKITSYLTTQETAEVLGIKRSYVQQLHRRGRFPHTKKVGNNLFISPSDIEAYKREKETAAERRLSYHSVADQYKAQYYALQESLYMVLKILDEGLDSAEPEAIRESAEVARNKLKKALNNRQQEAL